MTTPSQVLTTGDPGHSVSEHSPIAGFATFTLALASLVYGLIESNQRTFSDGLVIGCFIASAVLLVAFVLVESHTASPMFDLSLFRLPTFSGGLVAAFGSLWVASQRFASVTRVDPVTNSVIAILHLAADQTPLGLATDGHYIYAGGVSRIDPATNQIAGSLLVPDAFGGVAYGDGVLWVTTINGVYRVLPDGLRP